MNTTTLISRLTIVAWITSGLGYVVFPPFYEDGAARIYVPLLGSVDFIIAYALFRKSEWLKPWALPIYIGTLVVAIPFFGKSSVDLGSLAIPMLISESAALLAAIGLLALSFSPDFRSKTGSSA